MSPKFLFQTMLLLILGQVLLGGLGWLLVGAAPWAGLPVTLLLVWFIRRVGLIFREEAGRALKRGEPVLPGRLAFFLGLGAQLFPLLVLPFVSTADFLKAWQGGLLPVVATLSLVWPPVGPVVGPWLSVGAILQIALFVWVARAPVPVTKSRDVAPVKVAVGEWAPARRIGEVNRKGRRVK